MNSIYLFVSFPPSLWFVKKILSYLTVIFNSLNDEVKSDVPHNESLFLLELLSYYYLFSAKF